ncbi:OLC1v1036208C1 [Oldenlandia corymbosa var. corymbosa]|uniref:OLC1v1036208C1 n=1 Tax=Oldenlandia corymbosa var. corymbosa TaxID=529605 RepID=A0AAV1CUU6_OLDCO|nr:OLC1v1036208C1 [Oldenlandia corymbosa var. corymbosa]
MSRSWLFFSSFLVLVAANFLQNVEGLGVNWGTVSSNPLPPEIVVQLLKDNGINKVKLFDADPKILKALAGTGIETIIATTNLELADFVDASKAKDWVKQNVIPYNPTSKTGVNITYVAVGNEPFLKDYKDRFTNVTAPALKNIQDALNEAGLGKTIKATVPFNGDVYMSPAWKPTPSGGIFRPDIVEDLRDILKILDDNNSPFVVNIYPFLSLYFGKNFPLDYAFFDGATPLQDGDIAYTNVLDANLDTLVSALKAENYSNMTIIVGEIGWPTDGNEFANATLASRFYQGLMKHLASNKGSPLHPGYLEVYMFGLLDEDAKSILPGDFERSWGIFTYDGKPKFPLDLSGKGENKTMIGAKNVKYLPKQWCVLKSDATNDTKIGENADYACKNGGDCTPLADDSSCNFLDDKQKASFSFNEYFQTQNQVNGSCGFDGLATVTLKDPSLPKCTFKIGLAPPPKPISPSPAPAPAADSDSKKDPARKSSPGSPKDSPASATSSLLPAGIFTTLILAGLSIFAQLMISL